MIRTVLILTLVAAPAYAESASNWLKRGAKTVQKGANKAVDRVTSDECANNAECKAKKTATKGVNKAGEKVEAVAK